MRTNVVLIVLGVTVAACSSSPGGGPELVAAEPNNLGLAQIEIDHGASNGDRMLTVRGLGQDDQPIAVATLRTGMVLYGADLPEAWSAGTELIVSIAHDSQAFVSPDRVAHTISEPGSSELATFLRLPSVAAELRMEAGIQVASPSGGEVAFAAAGCTGGNFPTDKGSPSQCCQDGLQLWHKIASGTNLNKLANRAVLASGGVCRDSAGNVGCVDAACSYGPCGAQVLTVPGTNTTAAAVFTPTSAPTQCGRDSNGSAAGGGIEAPEAYTGGQSLYPGVTATCPPYTACNTSGSPGIHITIRAFCPSVVQSGTIWFGDDSLTCTGRFPPQSKTIWFPYNSANQIFEYVSNSSTAFSGWSGACSGTGACSVTATADGTVVTANFACVGLSC